MVNASVSVIIPCFNAEDTILRALESVKNQTLPVLEIICVDDHSTDKTIQCIDGFRTANPGLPLKILVNATNCGPSTSRNSAWEIAYGDYIAFLDADDAWHPEKVAIQYSWMRAHPEVSASGHDYVIVDPVDSLPDVRIRSHLEVRRVTRERLLLSNPFVTPSIMLNRNVPHRFDPSKRYVEDYLLLLELGCDGYQIVAIGATLVYVFKRIGKSGISSNLLKMRMGDIDNYRKLRRSGKLSFVGMSSLILYSGLKFIALLLFSPKGHYALKRVSEDIIDFVIGHSRM